MSRTDSTFTLPPGRGFTTVDSAVDADTFTVLYDADNDTVAIDLDRVYLRLSRLQWLTIAEAIANVIAPQTVTA